MCQNCQDKCDGNKFLFLAPSRCVLSLQMRVYTQMIETISCTACSHAHTHTFISAHTLYATIIRDRTTSGKIIIFNIHGTFTKQSLRAHIINGNIHAENQREN